MRNLISRGLEDTGCWCDDLRLLFMNLQSAQYESVSLRGSGACEEPSSVPCHDFGNSDGLGKGLIYYCLLNYMHSLLLLQRLDSSESAFGVKCGLSGMAF